MKTTDPDLLPPEFNFSEIDDDLLKFYGILKAKFPGIYVNVKDGVRVNRYCGIRPASCSVGSPKSAHKQCRALDLHYEDLNALRIFIANNGPTNGIRRMESVEATPTWVHIDTVIKPGWPLDKIYVFKP